MNEIRFFNKHGREVESVDDACSKVHCQPHDFKFYVKHIGWFGKVNWRYHHTSSTFGSWMWPDGMPLRFDGVDNEEMARDHARKIGADWGFN